MPFSLGDLTITRITLEGPDVPGGPLGTAEVYGTGIVVEPPAEIPLNKFDNYWRLDADGNDSVGTAHGTLNEVTFETSDLGNAATFTGATTCNIELPANVLTSDTYVGVSYLFRTNEPSKTQRVLGLNNSGNSKPFINTQISSDTIYGKIHSASHIVSTGNNLEVFNHVFLQASEGGLFKMYINGVLEGEISIVNFSEVTPKGNFLGASRTGFSSNLNGQMLGVSKYNENVTGAEILAIATKQLSGEHIF